MKKARATVLLLSALMISGTAVHAEGQPVAAPLSVVSSTSKKAADLASEYRQFLQEHYQIAFTGVVKKGDYLDAVAKLFKIHNTSISADALIEKGVLSKGEHKRDHPVSVEEAVSIAVRAAGLKELAYTYPVEKASQTLKEAGIQESKGVQLPLQTAQELAAAIDTQLLPRDYLVSFRVGQPLQDDAATVLLGNVLVHRGEYKNYLGELRDSDIAGKVAHAWYASRLINAEDLQRVVDQALKQNLVTGYNLKDANYDPRFDPKRTITYGHSDIIHAIQLIGLLKSEGLQAKVQFEPKTSAFVYLKEWGTPTETPDYQVVQIENGNYIAYSKEYDLSFEFENEEQKIKFQPIIFAYAKKNREDQTGLLAGSWWQPLYYSLPELKDYKQITNHVIKKDNIIAQSFTLNEQSPQVVEGFKKLDPSIRVTSYPFWVDQPFYNYLLGESK